MSVDERATRPQARRGRLRRFARGVLGALGPTERSILTREGFFYFLVSLALLVAGLIQQINLILLVFTLAAGPFLASIFGGRPMLRRLTVVRRVPAYVFSGDPLVIDYALENGRRWYAALALFVEDSLIPVDRTVPGATALTPRVFFPRVPGQRPPSAAMAVPESASRTLPLPRPGHRHAVAVRDRRASGHDLAGRPDRRLSHDRPVDPPMVHDPAAGDREPPRPAARPLGAAAGISRPARLPLRGQPAVDPLADLGAPRRADGQGVRAAERAGPGDPDRPLAAADQGHPRAARGRRAGDLVRRDGLPGDLPAPGAPAAAGLDRADPRRPPRAGVGQAAPRAARTARHAPIGQRGGPRRTARRPAAGRPPRGDPHRGVDPAAQPPRGGRALQAAGGHRRPRHRRAHLAAQCLAGRPHPPLPDLGQHDA